MHIVVVLDANIHIQRIRHPLPVSLACLRPRHSERGAGAHTTTATGRRTGVCAIVGTGLRSVGAVLELISERADVAGGADEHASIHVRGAARANNAEAVSVHVDFTADVDNTIIAKGELHPCVGGLAVDELGVAIDGSASAGRAVGEGDSQARPSGDRCGDGRLDGIDPRACNAPADQHKVFAGIVLKVGLVRTILGQPGLSVGDGGVDTQACNTKGGELGGISIGQGCGTFLLDVVVLACVAVEGRMLLVANGGSICLASCKGGQHQGVH